MSDTLANKVRAIPGPDGWWKQDAERVYHSCASVLVADSGWDEDDAVEFLTMLYQAAAECFGD